MTIVTMRYYDEDVSGMLIASQESGSDELMEMAQQMETEGPITWVGHEDGLDGIAPDGSTYKIREED